MTKENWQRCLEIQCVRLDSLVCMPAALDRISTQASVKAETYIAYENEYWRQEVYGVDPRQTRRSFQQVLNDSADTQRLKNVGFRRSTHPDKTTRILQAAREGGFRILIYTHSGHVVGLIPHESGGWTIEDSTQLIDSDPPIYDCPDIHDLLYKGTHTDRKNGKWRGNRQANILLFPPERRLPEGQRMLARSDIENNVSGVNVYHAYGNNINELPDLSQATVSIEE